MLMLFPYLVYFVHKSLLPCWFCRISAPSLSQKPELNITNIEGNNVTLTCSFQTLEAAAVTHLYEVLWYNGNNVIDSLLVDSSMYTIDSEYNTTSTFGTEINFSDGVIRVVEKPWIFSGTQLNCMLEWFSSLCDDYAVSLQYLAINFPEILTITRSCPDPCDPLSGPLFKQWNLLLSFV